MPMLTSLGGVASATHCLSWCHLTPFVSCGAQQPHIRVSPSALFQGEGFPAVFRTQLDLSGAVCPLPCWDTGHPNDARSHIPPLGDHVMLGMGLTRC